MWVAHVSLHWLKSYMFRGGKGGGTQYITSLLSAQNIILSLINSTLTIYPEYIKNYKLSNTETSQ